MTKLKIMLAASIAVAVKQAILDTALIAADQGQITPQTLTEILGQCDQAAPQKPQLAWFEQQLPGITEVVTTQINQSVAQVLEEFQVGSARELIAQL